MSDWIGALIGAAERTIRQLATHKRPKRNPIQQVVLQAKQAGIHPLVALQGGFSGAPLYGSNVDWSTDSGFGDAIGGFQNYLEEEQAYARDQANYDRRRKEDFDYDRSLRNAPPSAYEKSLTDLNIAQTRRIMAELDAASKGATQGGNSWPIPPRMYDVDGTRVVPSRPGLNQDLQPHYGEGADYITAPIAVDDVKRAVDREGTHRIKNVVDDVGNSVDVWVEDKLRQILKQIGF